MMETTTQRTSLCKQRSFSEKLSDTLSFVATCWMPLLRVTSVVLVPLCLLAAIVDNVNLQSILGGDSQAVGAVAKFAVDFVSGVVCDIFVVVVTYCMMDIYHRCNADGTLACEDMGRLSVGEFWKVAKPQKGTIRKLVGSLVLLCAVIVGVVLAIAMFAGAATAAMNGDEAALGAVVVILVVMLLLVIPFWVLSVPAYSLDGLGFMRGLSASLCYGVRTWAGVVAVMTIFSVVGMVVSLPFELLPSAAGTFLGEYVVYMMEVPALVALGYQYGHAKAQACDIC